MHIPQIRLLFFVLLVASMSVPVCAQGQNSLTAADHLYAENSFALALKQYDGLMNAGVVPDSRRDEVAYRICVCLGRSEKWDRDLTASVAFVRLHHGTVWEPRGLYWLGRLYLALPRYGWRTGDSTSFDPNVPMGSNGEQPVGISFEKENPRNSRDAIEAAAVFYPAYRARFHTEAEEVQLSYDLASQLAGDWSPQVARSRNGFPPNWPQLDSLEWRIDLSQTYAPAWPIPKKLLYLYRRARSLAPSPHAEALAGLAEAYFVTQYQQRMRWTFVRQTKTGTEHLPYPYQELRPLEMYRSILADYPDDPICSRVKNEIAGWFDANGRPASAQQAYQELASGNAEDPWVKRAIEILAYRGRPYVGFDFWTEHSRAAFHLPSERVKIMVTTNKVARFHLAIRPLDLQHALTDEKPSDSPFDSPLSFGRLLGTFVRAEKYLGNPTYSDDFTAGTTRQYRGQSREVTLPLLAPGLYLVTVSIHGIRSAITLLVSDLKLLKVGSMLFATRAGTGDPAVGVPIRMIWTYQEHVG